MAKLTQLAPPRGGLTENVIFVHGLTGEALETWTSPPPSSAIWPVWLAEDIDGLAVWSVGYDAPLRDREGGAMHPTDLASNILECLLTESPIEKGDLILIGHSLGGP